jgi:cytochrome c-type biogenesis protein CcmH
MILWAVLLFILVVVLAILLLPLLRLATSADKRVDYDMVIYRDQLAEVEKDLARGLLSADQVETARTEILRRMLAAEDAEIAMPMICNTGKNLKMRKITALLVIVLLPIATLLTYNYLGAPELAGAPYAQRAKNDPNFAIAADVEQLAEKLKKNPEAKGFKQLGDALSMLKRYQEAANAYQRAIDLGSDNAGTWSELGESIALANDGSVVPEARAAFMKALKLEPRDARARFYVGLAYAQINKTTEAINIWQELLKDSPTDAPWVTMVKEHISTYSKQADVTSDKKSENMKSAPPTLETANKATADAIMAAPPEQQNEGK